MPNYNSAHFERKNIINGGGVYIHNTLLQNIVKISRDVDLSINFRVHEYIYIINVRISLAEF